MKTFTIESILTWGLEHNKEYGGFNLPISFKMHPTIEKQVQKLADKYETKPVFYGDSKTIYFRLWHLTDKQKSDLLGAGQCYVDIVFDMEEKPKESKNGTMYLGLKITGLRKSQKSFALAPKDEF